MDDVCKPCRMQGKITQTVHDTSTGDVICTECGLVLAERCIDESQEWRNFQDESVHFGPKVNDRMRGGDAAGQRDPITNQLSGTSFTGAVPGFEGMAEHQLMADQQLRLSSSEKALKTVSEKMKAMTQSLNLSESILQRCLSYVRHLSEKNKLGPKHDAAWCCAIVYVACREESASRTISELAHSVASPRDLNAQDFEKLMKKKVKQLQARDMLGLELTSKSKNDHIPAQELMGRFVSKLELSREVFKPAVHIAEQMKKRSALTDRRVDAGGSQNQQAAIVATAILIVAHLLELPEKPSQRDLAIVARIPESAVTVAYEETIYFGVEALLPEALRIRCASAIPNLPPARPPPARQPVVPSRKAF